MPARLILFIPIWQRQAVFSKQNALAIMPKKKALRWPCILPAHPYRLWLMYIAQPPHKTSWRWNTTHSDNPWWETLVKTTDGRKLFEKGYANVPLTAPGLGIELVEETIKQHLAPNNKTYFAPTPEWNDVRSHDRLWS